MTTEQELNQLQSQFSALLDKTTGQQRTIVAASLQEIEACRLDLYADALQAIGHTAEAARARLVAKLNHAQADKVLGNIQKG